MNTAIIRILSVFGALSLWGCAGSAPPQTLTERYQQVLQSDSFSVVAMQNIVQEAYAENNLALMGNALWKLCQHSVSTGGNTAACETLLDVAIIQKDPLAQARSYLAQHFITGDVGFYKQALAALPEGESDYHSLFDASVEHCLAATETTGWLAMQCYRAGKEADNEAALEKALSLFTQFDARHNMADSYFLLAKIKYQQQNLAAASDYASKAALLLNQLGEMDRAAAVRHWRQVNVYAQ